MRRLAEILVVGVLVAVLLAAVVVRLCSSWRSSWSAYSQQLMMTTPQPFLPPEQFANPRSLPQP